MSHRPADPAQLASAAKRGDRQAFAALCRIAAPVLHRVAWRILGDGDMAADAVQETLIKLAGSIAGYDPKRPLWPWLHRIGLRTAIDLQRRERRRRAVALPRAEAVPAPAADRPDRRYEAARRRELLGRTIADLPEKQRTAVTLRDLAGLPTAEVAETMGTTASTVRVHLARARRRIRTAFAAGDPLEVTP